MTLAFSADLIPKAVQDAVHAEFQIRPLASDDYARGHLQVLAVLTVVPDVGEEAWQQRFKELVETPSTYYPLVIVRKADDKVVGCGTLVLERKFLRSLGLCGHIEDIAVSKDTQGKGLGKRIIEALVGVSEGLGAYKTILDCNKDNITFYEKCGFEHKEYEMVRYAANKPARA